MEKLISLCMIVKNEEKTLRRCIESVHGLVDEIIIIDTGSTDQTKSIAFEFTPHVYDYQWTQDFAAARNESIQRATGQWILVLDADEYVQNEDKQKLKEYLSTFNSPSQIAFILPVMNLLGPSEEKSSGMMESSMVRLFSNNKHIRFINPIHEQITFTQGKLTYHTYSFFIFHTGYTAETVSEKNKSQRNLEIFENMKKKKKLDPYYCYSLGNEYSSIRNFQKAIYYYEKAYSRANPTSIWLKHCIDAMINNYMSLNRFKDALALVQTGITHWPEFSDFHFYSGLIYHYFGLYDRAKEKFIHCIQISDNANIKQEQASLIRLETALALPGKLLVEIFEKELDLSQTVFYLSKILKSDPSNYKALLKLIQILSFSEEDASIITYLDKIYPLTNTANAILLFRIMLMSANKNLAEYYYAKCNSYNIALGNTELHHQALLANNAIKFKSLSTQLTDEQIAVDDVSKILLLGALIWRDPTYLSQIITNEHNTYARISQFILALLEEAPILNLDEQDDTFISILVVELFNLQQYDTFDWIMSRFSTPYLINLVANYFYSMQKYDLAMDYYSLLLGKNELLSLGYENLAMLYIKQGEIKEGISFLEKAIELNPLQINLYLYFCVHCDDRAKKELYKKKFADQFPLHKSLPFIREI